MPRELFPLLLIGDAPSAPTGLGRIVRDLSTRIRSHLADVFQVATLGYGGPGSSRLGFPQYVIEGMEDWVIPTLPQVWEDFAANRRGAVFTVWDPSRLTWFSQPARCELLAGNSILRQWLVQAPFERWGYFAIDAEGPHGKLSFPIQQTLLGFDRVLAYSDWARKMILRSLAEEQAPISDLSFRPHGIDTEVFFESYRPLSRTLFFEITGAQTLNAKSAPILDDELLLGIVATNQARKDWALGIQTAAILSQQRKVRLWIHTDRLERHWSIPALLIDYGLVEKAVISLNLLSDEKMAQAYSACDVTLGIGLGEGFGYPLAESLACGTPVVHGDYGGGAEIVPPEMRIAPIAFRAEGLYSSVRPVFDPHQWVKCVLQLAGQRASLPPQYAWSNLWPRWEEWFRKGIA